MAADRPRRRQSQLRATGARPEPAHAASTGFLAAGQARDDRTADAERDDAWRREVRRGVAGTLAMEAGRRGVPDPARFAAPRNGGPGETGRVGREMPRRQSSLPPGATTPDADILSGVSRSKVVYSQVIPVTDTSATGMAKAAATRDSSPDQRHRRRTVLQIAHPRRMEERTKWGPSPAVADARWRPRIRSRHNTPSSPTPRSPPSRPRSTTAATPGPSKSSQISLTGLAHLPSASSPPTQPGWPAPRSATTCCAPPAQGAPSVPAPGTRTRTSRRTSQRQETHPPEDEKDHYRLASALKPPRRISAGG